MRWAFSSASAAHRLAAQHDQRGQAAAQDLRRLDHLSGVGARLRRHRQRLGDHAAVVPRRVRRQDQRGDLPRMGARGLHRDGGIGAHGRRRGGGAHPGRGAARPALGVGGQRRVIRAVVGRLVAHDVDDRRLRAARVVQVGQTIRQARPTVQQRCRGLARHARITIGRTGHHALEQAQHTVHAGHAIERRHEVHLGRAGVGKAGVDAALQQCVDETFGAVHGRFLLQIATPPELARGVSAWQPYRAGDPSQLRPTNPTTEASDFCRAATVSAASAICSVRVGKARSTPMSFTRSMIRRSTASRSRNSAA